MNDLISIISIAFATGFLVKTTDNIIDHKKQFYKMDILTGILYGILIGLMISRYPQIAPLWAGVVIGNIFSGKMDGHGHLASIPATLFILFFGFQKFSIYLTLLFIIITVLEEKMHDRYDNFFFRYRLVTEIAVIMVAIIMMNFEMFFALLSLDVGYILTDKIFMLKHQRSKDKN